jgi:RNA polymerase sigma-70 factor (ECF subfamily)
MCHNTEDARDLTQSVFIKVYEKLAYFNQDLKFFSWIYRIAINDTLNFLNQKKSVEELPDSCVSEDRDPGDSYEQHELSENIQRALLEVEAKYRALILLKHFQNYTYNEIAQVMDLPEKTVKSRLFIARQQLGKILRQKGIY